MLNRSRSFSKYINSLLFLLQTFLPALEELIAHHNNITALDKDFHGLPLLCLADLSYNQIRSVNYDLVSKTHCTINRVSSVLKIYLQGESNSTAYDFNNIPIDI